MNGVESIWVAGGGTDAPAGIPEAGCETTRHGARWTAEDIARLQSGYSAGEPVQKIALALGRTPATVSYRKFLLRLKRVRFDAWKPDDDERLRTDYEAGEPVASIAAAVGRTEKAVRKRIHVLSLSRPSSRRFVPARADTWMSEQDERIRAGYDAGESVTVIARAIGRTPGAVSFRARRLGITHSNAAAPRIRTWASKEETRLARLYEAGKPLRTIARLLGRTVDAVSTKARSLGLVHPERRTGLPATPPPAAARSAAQRVAVRGPSWSADEDAIVRSAVQRNASAADIARALASAGHRQRSAKAVRMRVWRLGLNDFAGGSFRRWTRDEEKVLAEALQMPERTAMVKEAARSLGRSEDAVRAKIRNLGIPLPAQHI